MSRIRAIAPFAALVLLAACGKKESSNDAPLAFVPEDTAYVYANLEALPAGLPEQWSKPLQDYWPTLATMYASLLQEPKLKLSERSRRIAGALIEEFRTHASWDKLRAVGFKPDARVAIYAIGLVPVLRLELGDPAAFRAEVARLEKQTGETLPVAKAGELSYWQLGTDTVAAAIAIEGTQLVVTVVPPNAGDALKQTLLGIKRPARSLADSGNLAALAKQFGFSNYGAGYVDFVRMVERVSKPLEGSDAEFARAIGLPAIATDATCRREYLELAHKMPRFVIGAEELSAQRLRIGAQLEMDPALAARVAAASAAAPGSGAPADGAVDIALALPLLKIRDFWVDQADAVAAKPFACANLAGLNEAFAQAKTKIDVTVPPPLSDLTGARVSLAHFDMSAPGTTPDVAGKLLLGTSNPMAAIGMAQLMMPPLQKLRIAPDSKPVALPPDLLPVKTPPLSLAVSDKAIAFASGSEEIAALPAFLSAPAAAEPQFLRIHVSGAVYGWLARSFGAMKVALPDENRKVFDQQIALFGLYEKWLRSNDITVTATPSGIRMRQTIELNAP